MGRKGESITLSLNNYEREALEKLAKEYGMMWGDRPSISKLLKAIAKKDLLVAANHDWSEEKIGQLDRIKNKLVDYGENEEAKLIARILSDRSEINQPLRQKISEFIANPLPAWRQKIDEHIKRQQPMKLVYQDASDRIWQFTIIYARVEAIEKRRYLLCRCQESEGNQDIEDLQHNWGLRLDRIQEAEIIKIDVNWESNLELVQVEFHLFGSLAKSYEQKSDDIETSLHVTEKGVVYRQVKRRVFSTFWFFREILRYGGNCEIKTPKNVREKFILDHLKSLSNIYHQLD